MPTTKGTPGPWHVNIGSADNYGFDVVIYAETSIHHNPSWIARAYGPGTPGDSEGIATRDANARLIAAAPELRDALAALVAEADETGGRERRVYRVTVDAARAILAKLEME